MKRTARTLIAAATLSLGCAASAQAITFGEFDGEGHPNVGAMVVPFGEPPEPTLFCTGTLISPTVFLTASHCTDFIINELGIDPSDFTVTFDAVFDPATATLFPGTAHSHPDFGGGAADNHDIATIVLDEPVLDRAPARLPARNLLGSIPLKHERFTTVGYGAVRNEKQKGPAALLDNDRRNVATQGFLSLQPAWLNLNMNPSTGSGGTCYGDSGGPHFLRDSDVVVSITVTGDAQCRAADKTYRTDTDSARAFLDDFVTLP